MFREVSRITPKVTDLVETSWRVDEIYVKVSGRWKYLFRAVDKHGQLIDFMRLLERRVNFVTQCLILPCAYAITSPVFVVILMMSSVVSPCVFVHHLRLGFRRGLIGETI
jgi:hypothetical protein